MMDARSACLTSSPEFTNECLAIRVFLPAQSIDLIDMLSDLFILRGAPEHDSGVSRQGPCGIGLAPRCKDRLHHPRQPVGYRGPP
jgi:hypothetical protein